MRLFAVTVPAGEAELVADRCWEAGASGIWEAAGPGGTVLLRFGVPEGATAAVRASLAGRPLVDVTDAEHVELASREVLVGPADDPVRLVVPPTVFGDGQHPTTAACLDVLAGTVRSAHRVLDVGCGSGALSVVAARSGASVVAIDLDPVAVDATAANAAANGVAVDVSTTPLARVPGRFDVVLANISAEAVVALAEDLLRVTAAGGTLVVSGILAERWGEVADRLAAPIAEVRNVDGWVTATVVVRH